MRKKAFDIADSEAESVFYDEKFVKVEHELKQISQEVEQIASES